MVHSNAWIVVGLLAATLGGMARGAVPKSELGSVVSLLKDVALPAGGQTVFRVPDGPKGWYNHGFRRFHDGTQDWLRHAGIELDVELAGDAPIELTATLRTPPAEARQSFIAETNARVVVRGAGTHRVRLPWSAFDFFKAQPAFLAFIKELQIQTGGAAVLREVRLVKGFGVAIDTPVLGRSAMPAQAAEYPLRVTNCTDRPQSVVLQFDKFGWDAMEASVTPKALDLAAGAWADVKVTVQVSPRVAAGGREKQVLVAIPNGDSSSAGRIELITAAALPHPYVLHTPQRWQEVREKVAKYDWANKKQAEYLAKADKWVVPEVARAPKNLTGLDDMGPFLFATATEYDLMASGISYQLTGDAKYAQKVRQFLLNLSNPADGYPVTLRGCNQGLVQEGHFFQHIAMAYDMALPSGLFTEADKAQIAATFRLAMQTMDMEQLMGSINNWNLSELTGGLFCALVLQDMAAVDRFFYGPSGTVEQLRHGVLNDGWWYECAVSYNVWCTTEFTQTALALEPWGINFRDMKVPAGYSKNYSLRPFDNVNGLYGQNFEKWGPVTRNNVDIRRMWDSLLPFVDYRGVMFGVNDATERPVGGEAFDIAYYVYRDPAYAAMIKQGKTRNLLYGVGELPEETPELFRQSAYADNVGVAMLRSASEGKPDRERIQAVLHYGTHGGFHGHFDRTGLLHLSRFGRSFYNPEMVWYSYAPFMYKFYVQNSTSKNMVVVDRKMQEPVESRRLLWHTGKLFQAAAVETEARWSTPPYGGMVYPEQGYATLQEKAFGEGRFLPKPEKEPEYGSVNDFTEPVLQRRLMVVTDDYVLLADYVKGQKEHVFENLLQMKGFKGIEAQGKRPIRHDAQWDPNPVLDAQFVTDADWFDATAPVKATFQHRWGKDSDNEGTRAPESEDGVLNLGIYNLWPAKQEVMIATAPEAHPVEKRLFWKVVGDGKVLGEGRFGAWILGKDEIDVSIAGLQQLQLQTRVERSKKPTVFWANARIVNADGHEISLGDLSTKSENILPPPARGQDYFGGPVKIAGQPYADVTPAQPQDPKNAGTITVDLGGLNAVRLKAAIGGDYPLGDESQRRKTYASKVVGTEARFLTVIEPYENREMVKSARATDADTIRIELNDGRIHEIALSNFTAAGEDLGINVIETQGGKVLREERNARQER